MTELREANAAYRRMTVPDQQVIAAAINMMLTAYTSLRIPQLEALAEPTPEPKKGGKNYDT